MYKKKTLKIRIAALENSTGIRKRRVEKKKERIYGGSVCEPTCAEGLVRNLKRPSKSATAKSLNNVIS